VSLTVRNLSHRYPHSGWVLREISVRAAPAKITAVIGPNAAGKSTLLRCAIGALKPRRGAVQIHGSAVHRMRASRLAQAIAYVPQRSFVAADFTVRHIVELGRFALTPDHDKVEYALHRLELEDLAERRYHELSVGQQQRVTLARAVAQLAPDGHLIADEPTSAMDLRHVHDTMGLLRELAGEGATVLVAMHDLTVAASSADDVWLLDAGRLKAAGPAHDVMDVARLELVFNTMFERVRLQSGRHALVSIAPGTGERTTMAVAPVEPVVAAEEDFFVGDEEVEAEPSLDVEIEREPEEPTGDAAAETEATLPMDAGDEERRTEPGDASDSPDSNDNSE
jgi:iron complex transport system ATP-binding protein